MSCLNMKSFGDLDSSVFNPVGAFVSKEGREEEIKEDNEANERAGLLPVAVAPARPAEFTIQFPYDVAKMVQSIKEKVELGNRAKPTIYQVPRILRQVDEKWYEPQLISIGPYHRDKKHLQPMEEQKIQHLRKILSRNKKVKLEDYAKKMMELEQAARNCYSSQSVSQIPSDEFVKMMLLDGCFLVEIFLQNKDTGNLAYNDKLWLVHFVSGDMLLLENQLPYFVLECIYQLVEPNQVKAGPMENLVLRCFEVIVVLPLNKVKPVESYDVESYDHLVHLFRHHCLPKIDSDDGNVRGTNDSNDGRQGADSSMDSPVTSFLACKSKKHLDQQLSLHARVMNSKTNDTSTTQQSCFKGMIRNFARCGPLRPAIHLAASCFPSSPEGKEFLSLPSAEELDEAGIKFELPKQQPVDSFINIKFRKEDGVLEIPYLYFSHGLHSVIQNFVVFELCSCTDDDAFFVRYVCLMDCLISSSRDVKILRRSKVLEHGLGSDGELADVFNRMGRGVIWECGDSSPLGQFYRGVNEYCGADWHRWRAYWKHNYCYNPCTTVSLLAAFLLLLTVTQTYFSVFPRA